jgi:hypothetical protein
MEHPGRVPANHPRVGPTWSVVVAAPASDRQPEEYPLFRSLPCQMAKEDSTLRKNQVTLSLAPGSEQSAWFGTTGLRRQPSL